MRKRNDIIVSENVSYDKSRGVGSSKFELTDSVNIVASTTMSISAGTMSFLGNIRMPSIPQMTTESRILYMSSADNSIGYKTGVPLSMVLSASNSTGANDILFINGRKSYSTHNGMTSSYTFASGTSRIKSESARDYSEIYSASQSAYISTRKFGIDGLSYIGAYSEKKYTYVSAYANDMTVPGSIAGIISKAGIPDAGSASTSIYARYAAGVSPSDSDREAKITLKDNGFILYDSGNSNKYNTKYYSSAFATSITGSYSIATISWPGNALSDSINPGNGGEKVCISVKAWVIANYSSAIPGNAYQATHNALFVRTASNTMTRVSLDSSETTNSASSYLGSTIKSSGNNILIEVNGSSTNLRWRVHYEYIVGDYYVSGQINNY